MSLMLAVALTLVAGATASAHRHQGRPIIEVLSGRASVGSGGGWADPAFGGWRAG